MAIFNWAGTDNLDLKQLGESFDFRTDVLQISDPDLQAHQFDLVEVGNDLAIVLSRNADGSPLAAADITYAYIPNMHIRQIGVDAGDASQNIVMSNGGQLWVGARDTDTLEDDGANDVGLGSSPASSQAWGLGGADSIVTGSSDDRVYGNTGADTIGGGGGDDSLYGGKNGDVVAGGGGDDHVAGDLGNDELDGGAGNDILYGGAGNDSIGTGTGDDTVFAGAGDDRLTADNSATGDKLVYMDKGQDEVAIAGTSGSHAVHLGDGNDHADLDANSGDIIVLGESGNDTIEAQNSGADTLDGGEDDDVLRVKDGATGEKTLIGGNGEDGIWVDDASGSSGKLSSLPNTIVSVDAGGGDDIVGYGRGLSIRDANDGGDDEDAITFAGTTDFKLRDLSIQNFETVNFLGFGNHVEFADGNNSSGVTVTGGAGSDELDASAESSAAYWLDGADGEDTLTGGAGADTLVGGALDDFLDGGDGEDVYLFNHTHEGVDRIAFESDDTFAIVGSEFGMTVFDGYVGTTADGGNAGTNLYISTDGSFSFLDFLDAFFNAGGDGFGDTNERSVVFAFENGDVVELWYANNIQDIENTASMLAELQVAGGTAGLTLDQFVIL